MHGEMTRSGGLVTAADSRGLQMKPYATFVGAPAAQRAFFRLPWVRVGVRVRVRVRVRHKNRRRK
jgi:hypothetical protein